MGFKIRYFKTDDFKSNRLNVYLIRKGIKREISAAYTQDQNGPAERSGRVINTIGRAIRIGAQLPKNLWPECVKAAVYFLNI